MDLPLFDRKRCADPLHPMTPKPCATTLWGIRQPLLSLPLPPQCGPLHPHRVFNFTLTPLCIAGASFPCLHQHELNVLSRRNSTNQHQPSRRPWFLKHGWRCSIVCVFSQHCEPATMKASWLGLDTPNGMSPGAS